MVLEESISKLSVLVNFITSCDRYTNKITAIEKINHLIYGLIPERVIKIPIITLVTNVKKICGLIIKVNSEPDTIKIALLRRLKRLNPKINKPNPSNITDPLPNEEDQKCKLGNKKTNSVALNLYQIGLSFTFSTKAR